MWGALVGGALSLLGNRQTNRANAASTDRVNQMNAEESAKARAFAKAQVKDARKWDKAQIVEARKYETAKTREARRIEAAKAKQKLLIDKNQQKETREFNERQLNKTRAYEEGRVADSRAYELAQALAAEERGREYTAEDREDHRSYNDPAAVRARLEAAGINPAIGIDGSGGFVPGSSSIAPGSVGSNSFAPATETPLLAAVQQSFASSSVGAATSGIAQGAYATMLGTQQTAPDFGFIADAFNAVGDRKMQEAELALRQTQLDMENTRLTELMDRATMRPTVPGLYRSGPPEPYGNPLGGAAVAAAAATSDFPVYEPGSPIKVSGYNINPDPNWSQAEDSEARYGDLGGSLMGLGVLAADGWKAYNDSVVPAFRGWQQRVMDNARNVQDLDDDTKRRQARQRISERRSASPDGRLTVGVPDAWTVAPPPPIRNQAVAPFLNRFN